MSEEDQLGVRALTLLDERWMVPILHALADGTRRPAEIERRLGHAGHSTVLRRLRQLLKHELVTWTRLAGSPPHAGAAGIPPETHYELSDAGRALLEIAVEGERWERTWCPESELGDGSQALSIKLAADHRAREITLLLADGPLSSNDLEHRTPELARSTLRRRLRQLVLAGLLERRRCGRLRLYELTASARKLALIAVLAGRWECQWSTPARPAPGRDLAKLLRLLAPVTDVPKPLVGVCQLRLNVDGADDCDIYLATRGGHLALVDVPAGAPKAVASASPEALSAALLHRDSSLAISGDHRLLVAIIEALSAALLN